jgi:ethanolamine ammonia-lyase large subunit
MTADRAALVEQMYETFFKGDMNAVLDLIRAEVLEEAAKVADRYEIPLCETSASHIAAAIRALKAAP